MKVIDRTYWEYVQLNQDEEWVRKYEILRFGYPKLIEYFWFDEYKTLPMSVLAKLDVEQLNLCEKIVLKCKIVGWTEYLLQLWHLGLVSIEDCQKYTFVRFKERFHWIENIESRYTDYYENVIFQQLLKDERTKKLDEERPHILSKMKDLCFVWMNHFLGYNGDYEVENYFRNVAKLEFIHNTEWDYFRDNDLFQKIPYGSFTGTLIDYYGYAVKHIYFAVLLKNKYHQLILDNLFSDIQTRKATLNLIMENENCTEQEAEIILKCISLDSHNKKLYHKTQLACAPLIRISGHQYIYSMAGCLYKPFSFLLANLSEQFPKEVQANTNNREAVFRNQIYSLFDNSFLCIRHNIIIKKNNKVITDIDAAIIDKTNGEIGLFQLKWQGQTIDSPQSLRSKSKNFEKDAGKWVDGVQEWLATITEKELAGYLGVKAKYVDKTKIYLFVLGRFHGNYSGDEKNQKAGVWAQWYQFIKVMVLLKERCDRVKLSLLYDCLHDTSPYSMNITEEIQVYHYDDYTIEFGNP